MKAGNLTHKVNIYKEVIFTDEYGTQKSTYQIVYSNVRADKEDGNLYRQVVNDSIYSASSIYFIIRDAYKVEVGYLVKFDGDMYRVNSIKEMKSQRAIELVTELFEAEVQTDDTESTGVNIILAKMPTELRSALSLWYCPVYQKITNNDIRQERFILKDLSGNQRNAKVYHFDGNEESGIDDKGHIHFDGVDDFISLVAMQGDDLQGFANPYNGSTWFTDRKFEWNEPPAVVSTGCLFSAPGTTYTSAISSSKLSGMGLQETKSHSSKAATNGWGWYPLTSTSTSVMNLVPVDGVNYVVTDPVDMNIWESNVNYTVTGNIQGASVTRAMKWTDATRGWKFRSLQIGCQAATYSNTTGLWTLTYPFRGTFRALIIFNRALTTAEIEWVKNNMFNYEH